MGADRKRVLVVEDEATVRKLEAFVLEHAGYVVSEAQDGTAALDQLRGLHTDLLLLDIRMPEMNGWDVLEHVAAMVDPPVVVIVSGLVDLVPPRHLASHIGCVVSKPFVPAELITVCREMLDGH